MQFEEFTQSMNAGNAPANLDVYAQSMWYDKNNNWQRAHELIQHVPSAKAYWIHAYLHRKEGDTGNAAYWYHKAGKPMPRYTLEQEWEEIVRAIL